MSGSNIWIFLYNKRFLLIKMRLHCVIGLYASYSTLGRIENLFMNQKRKLGMSESREIVKLYFCWFDYLTK